MTAHQGPSEETTAPSAVRREAAASRTERPRALPESRPPAKFRAPEPRVELVERSSLLAAFAAADEPLVLVCAPPGTGKTTTLVQWTAWGERPTAWLQLEAADDDPVVLLLYLARTLGAVIAVDPVVEESLALPVPPVRERVLPLLGEALQAAPPFLLVLDDAHLLTNPKCWDVVSFVLHGLPSGAQLVLSTRADPPLPLSRLRTAGEVAEFRAHDLAFDRDEAAQLIRLHACCEPDDEVVDSLFATTEGWAAGLRLACRASCELPVEEWLPRATGSQREVAEYLTAEVIERQCAEMQEFLLRTSVLRELAPVLCQVVTGRDDAGVLLERAAHDELFIVPLADHGHRYRFHHLFGEVLCEELERRHPGMAALLHREAAAWYEQHDDPDATVHHWLAAGEVALAGDVVAASWRHLWNRGQVETVRRWLECFTDGQILGHRPLTLTAGWIYTALDAGELGAYWGKAACSVPVTDEPSPDGAASLRSSQALLRATVGPDGVKRMREDAELAAKLETATDSSWYADAQVALGVARWLSGSSQRALHPLAAGAREGSMYNPAAELAAMGYLSLIAIEEEEWATAEEYEARASARLAELGFGTNRRCLPMLLARCKLLARDPHADAESAAADVHRLLEHMVPHQWMALLTHTVLGEVALERGDKIEAEAHAAAAGFLLQRYPDAGVLRRRVEHLRRAVESKRVAEPLTGAEHRVLELLPTHYTEGQIAEHLFISRNTVKTHLKSVYRKLGASSRAEAVERAREAGLLPSG